MSRLNVMNIKGKRKATCANFNLETTNYVTITFI